jgi:hypothetical protein
MQSQSYNAADLAPWDPWNGSSGPATGCGEALRPAPAKVAHARARCELTRCRVSLVNARLALRRSQCNVDSGDLLGHLERARRQFQGAEETLAELEWLLERGVADEVRSGL